MKVQMKVTSIQQLEHLIDAFLGTIPHLEKRTSNGYRTSILSFVSYLHKSSVDGKFSPKLIKKAMISWVKDLDARYSFRTVMDSVRTVARFLTFLEGQGVLKDNYLGQLQKQYPKRGLIGIVLALLSPSPRKSFQALRTQTQFTSPLGPQMQDYIALAQGKKYKNEEEILIRLDSFLNSHTRSPTIHGLSESIIRKWLSSFPASVRANRYVSFGVVRRFCLYLRRIDPRAYVPDLSLAPPRMPSSLPYIYSRQEISALLRAARQLKPSTLSPLRPNMVYMLVLLLYTTGMRLGEVLNLQLGDIDWKERALVIRETKFFKSRLVPLAPGVMRELENYLQLRKQVELSTDNQSALFKNPHRKNHYSKTGARVSFQQLLLLTGIGDAHGPATPCIHSFRHTMAVHRIEEWYRQGEDVQSKLGLLSTYLGHVNISSTQRYLTMTTQLLHQVSQRFRRYANQRGENEE